MSAPRILVVDDEQQILRALRTSLRAAGYEVETAETAEGALAAAAMQPPELRREIVARAKAVQRELGLSRVRVA